jgi:glutaredoxin
MRSARIVVLALGVALWCGLACEPTLSVTPKQLDGFHRACRKRIEQGFEVKSSPNVGFSKKKPPGTPVVIYGAYWCEPCHIAAAYLEQRGIPFVEFDVDRDDAARAAMHAALKSASVAANDTLPVIDVRGTVITGFNPCVVDAAWDG